MSASDCCHTFIVDTILKVDENAAFGVHVVQHERCRPGCIVAFYGNKCGFKGGCDLCELTYVYGIWASQNTLVPTFNEQPIAFNFVDMFRPLVDQSDIVSPVRQQSTDHTTYTSGTNDTYAHNSSSPRGIKNTQLCSPSGHRTYRLTSVRPHCVSSLPVLSM